MEHLAKEKVLTEKDVADLSKKWELLKSENSLLRVVENGSVRSADISYYDYLFRKEFPQDTCKIAYLIGIALGKQNNCNTKLLISSLLDGWHTI